MAFSFPDAPVVGDSHTEAGVEYVYDGNGVWNLAGGGTMQDYVLKTGDDMTGPLNISIGAAGGLKVVASDPAHGHVHLSGGASDRTGMVEFFMGTQRKARFGWGTATEIEFAFENGSTGLRMIAGGLHWGSDTAQTDPLNMDKGICLYGYGGTSKFGFSITSGTLNYVVQNNANKHDFRVGANSILDIRSDGLRVNNGNLSIATGALNPRTSYNVVWQNGFSGTMDFRVNPAMVTMRCLGVKRNVADTTDNVARKICDYPAGVPAPWGTLSVLVLTYGTGYVADNRKFQVQARSDGVYFVQFGGGAEYDYLANAMFDCFITWSR